MSHKAKSARLPTSRVPTSLCRPSARAACTVAPSSASRGVRRHRVQAMFSASSSEVMGEVPGLQSVAIASGTPAARKASIGGALVSRRK